MKSIKCETCGRVLGKLDGDTFHVKMRKDGPQIFIKLSEGFQDHVMLVCPSFVHTPGGLIKCGARHSLDQKFFVPNLPHQAHS